MLSFHDIAIKRGGVPLCSGVGASFLPGALCVLRGSNGSGKTSLLRVLGGLDDPASGEVYWEGEPISASADFHSECQFVGHRNAMKDYLTVEENLLFWARLHDAEMLMPVATQLWQLEPVLDQRYDLLSAGWRRKVALARLLVSPGRLWLMDEPMANLDKEGVEMLERLVQSRCAQGGIVILTSHIELDIPTADILFIDDFKV